MIKQKVIFALIVLTSYIQIFSLEEKQKDEIASYEQLIELINSKEFQSFQEYENNDDISLQLSLFEGDECLIPSKEAEKTLSDNYGITDSSPDENLRFILGKCNPVLLIPGIYGTKLMVELNCKGIATYERRTTLKNIRLYCGDTICADETKTSEEHPLLVSLSDEAFSILGSETDKYSSCLGFIATHFQNEEECPKYNNNNNICYYSKYIKVGFYGGTTETVSKGRCGLEGIQNIIQSGNSAVDGIVNIGVARSFGVMSKELIKRGYKEGFSLGGLPNDYRRYASTNNFATKVFQSQINRLYSNTGKPVVVIAHSYGTLIALTNLLKKENKNILKKIKKFVAIAPPFSGSTSLLDAFLHGLEDWNVNFNVFGKTIHISNYNIFGQLLMYKNLPILIELRPLPFVTKLLSDPIYSEFNEAIKERIGLETMCRSKKCSYNDIKSKSEKFDNLFKGYFPSFTDEECSYESEIGGNSKTLNRKCFTGIYNVADCPTIIKKATNLKEIPTQEEFDNDLYCNKFDSNYYYQGECNNTRSCLDEKLSSDICPNVFSNKEAVSYLVNRFNEGFSNEYGSITKNAFESFSTIKEGIKNSISYHSEINLLKELPIPPVDTDLIYASFTPTTSALIINEETLEKEGEIFKAGDGKVPTWSSLLTGLKWIYEKKKNNLPQNIRLIEYCSRLSKEGQYKYDPNKEQTFAAIGCGCLKSKNEYKSLIGSCSHANMIGDDELIEYIISVIDDPKETQIVTEQKKLAVNTYKSAINYESICNNDLLNILNTAK